jgi:hypothetical protein
MYTNELYKFNRSVHKFTATEKVDCEHKRARLENCELLYVHKSTTTKTMITRLK